MFRVWLNERKFKFKKRKLISHFVIIQQQIELAENSEIEFEGDPAEAEKNKQEKIEFLQTLAVAKKKLMIYNYF